MDTELLKTFLEVNQTRHFGRAAENLFLTQAAVSARIKQLESALGSPVFTRYRNNLQLTETGRRLVPHAQAMLLAWDRAKQEVSLTSRQDLILGLGATHSLWQLFAEPLVNGAKAAFPDMVLRADAFSQEVMNRRILERTLDLGIFYEPAKHSDLMVTTLPDLQLQLVTTQDNPVEDLQALPRFINLDWGTTLRVGFAQAFTSQSTVFHTSLIQTALTYMTANPGCALLPTKLLSSMLSDRFVVVDHAPILARPICACYHRENKHEKNITPLIELVRNHLDALL